MDCNNSDFDNVANNSVENKVEQERRAKRRFPIVCDVRYKMMEDQVVAAVGSGQTVDIGSGGVAFLAEGPLTPARSVELSISWPVLLDERCAMRLMVFGRVLRCTGEKAVCTIDKYEFRTEARTSPEAAATRTDVMLERWLDGIRRGKVNEART